MSAAQSRQSVKGADYTYPESRMNQEGVFGTAVAMRPDHNPNMVVDLDEGAGVSGQKKIYQREKLKTGWDYLIKERHQKKHSCERPYGICSKLPLIELL
jgi:hypothetical protein